MYDISDECYLPLLFLGFTQEEIEKIRETGSINKNMVNKKHLIRYNQLEDYANQLCDLMEQNKCNCKSIDSILGLQEGTITDSDIDPDFSFYASDYQDDDEMVNCVADMLQSIFDRSSESLCNIISKDNFFTEETKLNALEFNSSEELEDKNNYDRLYPIVRNPVNVDESSFNQTVLCYLKSKETGETGILPGVYGSSVILNRGQDTWPYSLSFTPPNKMPKNGDILVSRAFTIGNSDDQDADKYDPLDFTKGAQDRIKASAKKGHGIRHIVYSTALIYQTEVDSFN